MKALNDMVNHVKRVDSLPEFFSTGNWLEDIKEINKYVKEHPNKFLDEDLPDYNGGTLCRSRLVLKPFIMGDGQGYAYIVYNKDGVEIGYKTLDIYNP